MHKCWKLLIETFSPSAKLVISFEQSRLTAASTVVHCHHLNQYFDTLIGTRIAYHTVADCPRAEETDTVRETLWRRHVVPLMCTLGSCGVSFFYYSSCVIPALSLETYLGFHLAHFQAPVHPLIQLHNLQSTCRNFIRCVIALTAVSIRFARVWVHVCACVHNSSRQRLADCAQVCKLSEHNQRLNTMYPAQSSQVVHTHFI